MSSLFLPAYRFTSVTELTTERLHAMQIDSLLLDVDCTLKTFCSSELEPQIFLWLAMQKAAGVGLCLLSNGRAKRIEPFAEMIGVPYVAPALKPLPFGVWKAVRKMNFDPKRTALVGDQIFADVMAANLAGVVSVLVSPFNPEMEPFYARWKRPFERLVLRRHPCGVLQSPRKFI